MPARRKISYWSEYFWPYVGGIETYSAALLPALLDHGFDVSVITSKGVEGPPDHEVRDGISIHRLPLRQALESRDLDLVAESMTAINRVEESFEPDVIHLNFSGPLAFFQRRSRAPKKAPLLTTVHVAVSELQGGEGTVLGDLLDRSDRIVANSQATLEDIVAASPELAGRTSTIYHGLDVPIADTPQDPHNHALLCAGRLVPVKGFEFAIQAFDVIRRRIPDATLTIAGDGPERRALEALRDSLGLHDSVRFLGPVDAADMPALYRSHSLTMVPSIWREAFGLVALEAALQQRPVVASAVGGIQEIVDHGCTGLLVEKESPKALAEAAISLLEAPDRRRAMGDAARNRAVDKFGFGQSLEKYLRVYNGLVSEG